MNSRGLHPAFILLSLHCPERSWASRDRTCAFIRRRCVVETRCTIRSLEFIGVAFCFIFHVAKRENGKEKLGRGILRDGGRARITSLDCFSPENAYSASSLGGVVSQSSRFAYSSEGSRCNQRTHIALLIARAAGFSFSAVQGLPGIGSRLGSRPFV